MQGVRKSKRVVWAPDFNLCQVKLFLSDESPSQVGLGGQDHLQAKAPWPSQSTATGTDDNLPPGFERIQPTSLLKNKLSQIPLVKWTCPPRFVLDHRWQVVAGKESTEVGVENRREMKVLEAIYPRESAIPPNPALLMGAEDFHPNDQQTPLIPITPIEDEETSVENFAPNGLSLNSQVQVPGHTSPAATIVPPPGVEPGVVSAAYNALTAAMKNSDQANLIDPNLLVQILSNPDLIQKLIMTHGASSSPMAPAISQGPTPGPVEATFPPVQHVTYPSAAPSSSSTYYPPASMAGPMSVPNLRPPTPPPLPPVVSAPIPPVKKDINYYKSLIQQHGGESQELVDIPRPWEVKPKIMKPCLYFNTPRGCRNGANCVYQHDSSSQQRASSLPEAQSAKRMKMEREITGT